MADTRDLCIVPDASGDVSFELRGGMPDTGLALLQRLYALMFSAHGTEYRAGDPGNELLAFLDGANKPTTQVMNSILALCAARAVSALDGEDRAAVRSFICTANDDGTIDATLTLADNVSIHGKIADV